MDEAKKKNAFLLQNIQEMKSQVAQYKTDKNVDQWTRWDTPGQTSVKTDP